MLSVKFLDRDLQIQFHVEAGKLCHVYYMYKEAREHYNTARKLAAITIQLTGRKCLSQYFIGSFIQKEIVITSIKDGKLIIFCCFFFVKKEE